MYDLVLWAAGISFLIAVLSATPGIKLLHKLKFGQYIRDDGPVRHLSKAGTPTMGGLIFLFSLTVTCLLFARNSLEMMTVLVVTLGFGLIGFVDDFIIIVLKRPLGLKARSKLLGQTFMSLVLIFFATYYLDRGTLLQVPFTQVSLDLGYIYYAFVVFFMVGFSNAVNLTDGLDGLAGGVSLFVAAAYVFICLELDQPNLAVYAAALAGGLLGFLIFNFHPAKIFMGDTGSLALGGGLAALAVLTGTELLFLIIGGVFVIETLSVILQVISFKFRGKRIFRMAPLHHHFELGGWSEAKVVFVFWAAGAVFAMVGMLEVVKLL